MARSMPGWVRVAKSRATVRLYLQTGGKLMKTQTLAAYRAMTPEQQRQVPPDTLLLQGGPDEFASLNQMQASLEAEIKAAGGYDAWHAKEKAHRTAA